MNNEQRFLEALREILEVGSRKVYQSVETEDGTYIKTLVKIDMSIEAMIAKDAIDDAGAEYI